jgi:probable rRNA maturation factor
MKNAPIYDVRIALRSGEVPKVEAKVRKAIRAALRRHGVVRARISVALVNDAAMARLNRDHLGHNGPTDVLSFDLRDEASEKKAIDGEIVMSVDMAMKQARERGHAVEAELALYAVHGTLHLLGYDDRRKADAARMHAMEDEVLSSIGFGTVYAKSTDQNAEL